MQLYRQYQYATHIISQFQYRDIPSSACSGTYHLENPVQKVVESLRGLALNHVHCILSTRESATVLEVIGQPVMIVATYPE